MRIKTISALLLIAAGSASAAQMTASADIACGGASYVGPGSSGVGCGYVSDGGFDAFDWFGLYSTSFPAGVTLNRRVELLSGNLYRWVDTFTNTTLAEVTANYTFWGDLGSDGNEIFTTVNSYFQVSNDGGSFDPVVGFIWGNNAFASTFSRTQNADETNILFPLTLAPGESKSLMFYAFLAREDTNRIIANDTALATNRMNQLFASPELSGLTLAEQSQIVNWNTGVPEPGTYALFTTGLAAIALARRRNRTRL